MPKKTKKTAATSRSTKKASPKPKPAQTLATPDPPTEHADRPQDESPPATRETSPPTTERTLPRCLAVGCESTEFEVLRKIGESHHCAELADGRRYTSIVRRRVRCRACGQVQVHKSHHFDPEAWV